MLLKNIKSNKWINDFIFRRFLNVYLLMYFFLHIFVCKNLFIKKQKGWNFLNNLIHNTTCKPFVTYWPVVFPERFIPQPVVYQYDSFSVVAVKLSDYFKNPKKNWVCLSYLLSLCCSSYSVNLANIALDLLFMIPVSYYLFCILHSVDLFRKVSIFSMINSAVPYYEFSYVDLKYLNKYQQCFVSLLTKWCVFFP